MKKQSLSWLALLLAVVLSVGFASCDKDDDQEETSIPETENTSTFDETEGDDSFKYDVVGTWKAIYTWSYSGIVETITMDINSDGTLTFLDVSTNEENDPYIGSGSWTYNSSNHNWNLTTSSSLVSGTYRLVNNQLINSQYFNDGSSRTIIFNKQ